MGTGFDAEHNMSANILPSQGILPRSLHHLFEEIHTLRQTALDMNEPPPRVTVKAQFVELYNEEINDLMDSFDLKVLESPFFLLAELISGSIFLSWFLFCFDSLITFGSCFVC